MKLTWYGHSAFKLEFGEHRVLIDPFLSGNPSWDTDWREPAQGCTHVLLTHGHDDHFGDTLDIMKAWDAQFVGSFEACMMVAEFGGHHDRINPGNHGGSVDCGGFSVSFVNSNHSSAVSTSAPGVPGETPAFYYMGNPLGLVIKAPGEPVVHAMGDTDIFSDMALINEIHRPDVGLVPVGDRFTMGGKIAAMACRRYFEFKTIIPCHYGSFPIIDQNPDIFVSEMGSEVANVVIPVIGEPIEV